MPWPTLVRKWFVVSVDKPFSERPWRSLYPHLHLLCICLYAHHYHYFSCSLFILKFTSCGQEHNFICHHIPIPHSSSTYCSSKIHLDIYLDTQAGEKYWHEHHFICCDCGVRIRGDSKVRKLSSSKNQSGESSLLLSVSSSKIIIRVRGKFFPSRPYPYNQVWQKEGRLYCDSDYKKKFVPRCADCSGFILGVIITITRPISILEFNQDQSRSIFVL